MHVVIRMYNLIEYSNNYSKTDDPSDNSSNSKSFNFKVKIIRETPDNYTKKMLKIAVPLN